MRQIISILGAGALLVLSGCTDSNSSSEQEENFRLQLLHLADVDGVGTAAMFNVDDFSVLTDHFRSEMLTQYR